MGAFALALGYALSRAGYTDWGEVNAVFTLGLFDGGPAFRHFRLIVMLLAGALSGGAVLLALARHDAFPARPVRSGTALGGALFGIGGAILGGCPAVAIVRLGEGRPSAPLAVASVLAGTWLARRMAARLRVDPGGCDD